MYNKFLEDPNWPLYLISRAREGKPFAVFKIKKHGPVEWSTFEGKEALSRKGRAWSGRARAAAHRKGVPHGPERVIFAGHHLLDPAQTGGGCAVAMGTMLVKYASAFTPPRDAERVKRSEHTSLGREIESVKVS